MTNSTLPFLFIFQMVMMFLAVRTSVRANAISASQAKALYGVLVLLGLWGPITAYLAISNFYTSPFVLEHLPGFFVTMVPVLLLMVPWGLSASFRDSITKVIDTVGLHRVLFFEGLRILAIGGIIKAIRGEFTAEFGFFIGIPDFIFGALSLWAGYLLYKKSLQLKWVVLLNIYGFFIIVPVALILMNMGIPGPWHIIYSTPDMVSLYEYPMALAPTSIVPVFITFNAFVVEYALRRGIHNT